MRQRTVLALLLLPLVWLTWAAPRVDPRRHDNRMRIDDLAPAATLAERQALGPFALAGIWRLTGADRRFGGFSALVPEAEGAALRAISDRNRSLMIDLPVRTGWQPAAIPRMIGKRRKGMKRLDFGFDIESAVRDPATGALWLGLEYWNELARVDFGGTAGIRTAPALAHVVKVGAMHNWPRNGGPEAMARLNDGRWITLCETCDGGEGNLHLGLIFAGHPGESRARKFTLAIPPGFDPVDAATLPDGRVLILVRRLVLFPPHFEARIMLADLAALRPQHPLPTQELARLDGRSIRENWEGMALVRSAEDHDLALWLISDANDSAFQETRLLQLRFDPARLGR
ncbi:MAG: esterase-like activity of phytase family protein [Novosphingobium sp.]|nr:esterase-like activity of phytase family protein [Novosphingobium sp.]